LVLNLLTQFRKKTQPKKPNIKSTTRGNLTDSGSIFNLGDTLTTAWVNALTGFIFGISVALGLGLNPLASIASGFLVALCVLVSGSLTGYLIIQTIVLSAGAAISLLVFRIDNTWSVDSETFQTGYLVVVLLSPLISLAPVVRGAVKSLDLPAAVQIFTSILFGLIVLFLRSRMPSDSSYALSQMYYGEDNAGIVANLNTSLDVGFASPHAQQFGEFVTGSYLAAAGLISTFGGEANHALLAILTHYNMTLLFMAWVPLAALMALAFSGKKFNTTNSMLLIVIMSGSLALLFWPFTSIGHTAVISSGLFALPLIALTLNQKLALRHPVLFLSLITALAFLVGSSWFPFMPFAGATVALSFGAILQAEYLKGKKKIVIGIVTIFAVLMIFLFPTILDMALRNGEYLQMQGGTRKAGIALVFIWGLTSLFVSWLLTRNLSKEIYLGHKLFVIVLGTLVASNVFLLVAGRVANSGAVGYGANKYLLTSIAFTAPLLWLLLLSYTRNLTSKKILVSGLVFLLVISLAQRDSLRVPATIFAPSSVGFLVPPSEDNLAGVETGVIKAITTALEDEPDQLFCVSDYGFPAPNEEISMDSYFCTRWGQSLTSAESGAWRMVPLDREPERDLVRVQKLLMGQHVIVVRLISPPGEQGPMPDPSDVWWQKYVDKSWKIINVP
jgi:hypothetical protein